ncbi:putative membrane protein [Desulfovibrio sp. A2]|nr:putative membrane protein [Desulfovibrio sp. A2]
MQNIELPLVLFTVLSQAAVGMALFLALRSCACATATGPATGEDAPGNRTEWLAATAAMGVALLASLFHLGHPEGAVRTLAHLEKAWLSREILAFGAFSALLAVAAVTGKAGAGLRAAAALVGLFALYTSGMTYAPPAMPALHNAAPLGFFVLSALLLGASFGSWFAGDARQPMLRTVLLGSLAAALAVYVIVPCVWASGGAVMQMTARAWLASPLYWARLVLGILVPLVALARSPRIPHWMGPLVLLGELAGRAVFFGATVHAAVNLGAPY